MTHLVAALLFAALATTVQAQSGLHFNLLQGRCLFPLAHKHPNEVAGVDSLEAPSFAEENASGKSAGYIDIASGVSLMATTPGILVPSSMDGGRFTKQTLDSPSSICCECTLDAVSCTHIRHCECDG